MEFFEKWFQGFGEGLENLNDEERGRLFGSCASACGKDALKYLYQGLFNECEGNLDTFFSRLHEVHNADGKVIEPGKVYEIMFLECNCPVHTDAHINTSKLCECSRQSILFEFKQLLPDQKFIVEQRETILNGDPYCCFRISKE